MARHRYIYDFVDSPVGPDGPFLPITFINPDTGRSFQWDCLIDTGAATCLFTADLAEATGHDLDGESVSPDYRVGVELTRVTVWMHSFRLQLMHPTRPDRFVWESDTTLMACGAHTQVPQILGVRDFLKNFHVGIDYPNQRTIMSWES